MSRQTVKKTGLILGPILFFIILLLPINDSEFNSIRNNPDNNSIDGSNKTNSTTFNSNEENAINNQSASLSFSAKLVLATTFWLAVWWITEAIPIYVTALLPLILFPSLSITELDQTAANYADRIIFLFLGGFILAKAVEKTQLHRRFALNILNIFGTTPKYVVAAFMLVTGLLSGWMSNTATTMLMLPIAGAVIANIGSNSKKNNDKDDDNTSRFGLCLMLSIAYSASIGGLATLIGTPPNAILASLSKSLIDVDISFGEWLLIGLPISGISLVIAWLYMVNVGVKITDIKPIENGRELIKGKLREIGKITKDEKIVAGVFAATASAWITRGLIWGDFVPMIDDTTIAVIAAFSLFLIPSQSKQKGPPHIGSTLKVKNEITNNKVNGTEKDDIDLNENDQYKIKQTKNYKNIDKTRIGEEEEEENNSNKAPKNNNDNNNKNNKENGNGNVYKRILDWDAAVKIPWGVLLLIGGGLALADGFTTTGLDEWISSKLEFIGNLNYILIVLVIVAVGILASEIMSNTATAALLIPITVVLASSISINPLFLMIPLTIATTFGFMMPVGTPPNAIVFGSGYVSAPKMAKAGFPLDIIGIILVTLLATMMVPLIWGGGG